MMAMSRPLRASHLGFSRSLQLNLLLLGKTGQGKSATGNSILLDKEAFKTSSASTSCTTDVQSSYGDYITMTGKLYEIKVIDGPGLQDTTINKAQDKRRAFENIARVLKECDSGIHAFILVIRMGVRFTEEDKEAVDHLKDVLGKQFLQNYGTIVITNGEALDDDDEEPKTFKEWCSEQSGHLKDLFTECNYRCVLFSNKTKDESTKIEQVETLLETVEAILHNSGGRSYRTELFEQYSAEHDSLIKEFGIEVIKEDFRRHLSKIQKQIRHIHTSQNVRDTLSAHNTLLGQVNFEVKETGSPKKLQTDLEDLEKILSDMKKTQTETEAFKALIKKAKETINRTVDRASFPANPNFCERIKLRFDSEYSSRYF